jgi:DNA topoisomerase-1
MPRALVIVESPAKAKTIAGFLDDDVIVEASIGHVRDLATKKELPGEFQKEPWAEYGVDIYNGFKAQYVVDADKKAKIRELKALLKQVDELYLATDEDREGEAIAWHLLEVLKPPKSMPVKRMVFHEITPAAIRAAIESPREINQRLVDAQETRRILDRLYGWDLSKVIRRVVTGARSAGRVQSVAVRLVVERERERMAFTSASYWDLEGQFDTTAADSRRFSATLVGLDGAKVASGKDFDANGVAKAGVVALDEARAHALAGELVDAEFTVRSVEPKPYRRRPAAPFITSTFQQEAGRKLRMSSSQAMRAAQTLYENGYITYMRTDSTTLSDTALAAARTEIAERYGAPYLPDAPRTYAKKVKNAQEAHEAIRPAGDRFRSPDEVGREVGPIEARVYELIWQRTIASQMTDATGETVTVRLGAIAASGTDAEFATSGTVITHQGFRLAYVEDRDEGDTAESDTATERQLPPLAQGDAIDVRAVEPRGHETSPPARYTEASLVKRLEELGIGRPSTYASTIRVILDRGYVWKKGTALVPTWVAFSGTALLEREFPDLVSYQFTADLEDELDEIANGRADMVSELTAFYWGDHVVPPGVPAEGGLRKPIDEFTDMDIRPLIREVNGVPLGVDANGVAVEARAGKFGPYVSRGEDTASIPEFLPPDELTLEKAIELLATPKGGRPLGEDPATGLTVYAKAGRYGPYVQLGEMVDGADKPKMASLFATMSPEDITLDDALQLLSLPRVVGTDPADGVEITAQNGRYGPYISKGKESRSLEAESQLFTVTVDDCLRLLAEPKRRRGQTTKPPLAELGDDPVSGRPMVVKEGRFGPYVTDGETNASLRRSDDPENMTPERGSELLAERRAAGPSTKKRGAKKAAPKSTTRRTVKKGAAKKAAAKKGAAKKAPAKKAGATKAAANKAAAPPVGDDAPLPEPPSDYEEF